MPRIRARVEFGFLLLMYPSCTSLYSLVGVAGIGSAPPLELKSPQVVMETVWIQSTPLDVETVS